MRPMKPERAENTSAGEGPEPPETERRLKDCPQMKGAAAMTMRDSTEELNFS